MAGFCDATPAAFICRRPLSPVYCRHTLDRRARCGCCCCVQSMTSCWGSSSSFRRRRRYPQTDCSDIEEERGGERKREGGRHKARWGRGAWECNAVSVDDVIRLGVSGAKPLAGATVAINRLERICRNKRQMKSDVRDQT